MSFLLNFYSRFVLNKPKLSLFILLIFTLLISIFIPKFTIDASSDTLIIQDDPDYLLSREVSERYKVNDMLIVAYTPKTKDLFSKDTFETVSKLKSELEKIPNIDSVFTYLEAPLFSNNEKIDKTNFSDVPNLLSSNINYGKAKIEFQTNPFYRNFLINKDLDTTAIVLRLKENQPQSRNEMITDIRNVITKFKTNDTLFLGGITMIADDMVTFIKADLRIFGLAVFILLNFILYFFFGRFRWVIVPMACCIVSLLIMVGLLGFFEWKVTVISSSFISVQLIITLAIGIHLAIKFNEVSEFHPDWTYEKKVLETIRHKFLPCLYAALTTIVGFASLIFTNILSVIMFGWMMVIGIVVSFIVTFILFPSLLLMYKNEGEKHSLRNCYWVPHLLSVFTQKFPKTIAFLSLIIFCISAYGVTEIEVENRFIDYFKKDTEIYQGLLYIDQRLGGTMPLELVLRLNQTKEKILDNSIENDDDFNDFDEFEDVASDSSYWFTPDKMEKVSRLHRYLETRPEIGKVLSMASTIELMETINNGKLDAFTMAYAYKNLPEDIKEIVINPYISINDDEARFQLFIRDTDPNLRRNSFLKSVDADIRSKLGFSQEEVKLTGVMVLYNKMLQSLFNAQILTLGLVLFVIFIMFYIVFRSFKLAFIGIVPNFLSIVAVLGFLGLFGIPLDIMTITIAAISLGIAVDDTIHYIYRFKEEMETRSSYIDAMKICHDSIGKAMYCTSVVIIVGFSILMLSSFMPSIYFGLLTGLAMLIALLLSLTLLPFLIIYIKPFDGKKS